MNIEYVNVNGTDIAAVSGGAAEATTPQAALDLAAAAWYEAGAERGAICGDYSRYTSKPLRDFIYESNNGKDFFFTASKKEDVERLAQAR